MMRVFWSMIFIGMLLTACNNTSDVAQTLPTRVNVESPTAEITETVATITEVVAVSTEVTAILTTVPPTSIPAPSLAFADIVATQGPPLDRDGTPEITPPVSMNDAELGVATSITINGLLTIITPARNGFATAQIIDEDGTVFEFSLAEMLAATLANKQVSASGIILGDAALTTPPARVQIALNSITDQDGAIFNPFSGELTEEPGDLPAFMITPTPATVVSALEAYDAVIDQIPDDVAGLQWVLLSGSGSDWRIGFLSGDGTSIVSYRVIDGRLGERLPETPVALISTTPLQPLDRDSIEVNSDAALIAGDGLGLASGVTFPVLFLLRTDDEPVWRIPASHLSGEIVVNAITGEAELIAPPVPTE